MKLAMDEEMRDQLRHIRARMRAKSDGACMRDALRLLAAKLGMEVSEPETETAREMLIQRKERAA